MNRWLLTTTAWLLCWGMQTAAWADHQQDPWLQCSEPMRCEMRELEAALAAHRAPPRLQGVAHAMTIHADLFHEAARRGASWAVLEARFRPIVQLTRIFEEQFERDAGCRRHPELHWAWRSARHSVARTQAVLEQAGSPWRGDSVCRTPLNPPHLAPSLRPGAPHHRPGLTGRDFREPQRPPSPWERHAQASPYWNRWNSSGSLSFGW